MKKTSSSPFNVIILGDPTSGKGTQSALLAKRHGMYDFDMGREVRKPSVKAKYDYSHTTAKGILTPTVIVRGILKHTLERTPKNKGIIFSGHPKMIGEAKLVERLLRKEGRRDPLVIYLHIPTREVLERIRARYVRINGKWVVRDDDNERALANRRRYYRDQIAHTVEFFRQRYEFKRISGMGTEAEVEQRIEAIVKRHIARNLAREPKSE